MRANGKRAGEWPDEEYRKRKARLSEADANGLGWLPIAEISADNRRRKPVGDATARKSGGNDTSHRKIGDSNSGALKMDFGDIVITGPASVRVRQGKHGNDTVEITTPKGVTMLGGGDE